MLVWLFILHSWYDFYLCFVITFFNLFVCLFVCCCCYVCFFWGGGLWSKSLYSTLKAYNCNLYFWFFWWIFNTNQYLYMQQIWTRIIGKQWVLIFILNFIGLIIIYDIYKWMKDFWVPSSIWLAKLLVEYQEIINWLALCMKTIKIYRKWENWGQRSLSYSMSFIKCFGLDPHSLSSESITDL